MRVALLISGGVDSTVALRLLCEKGYDVSAFYLKIWLEDEVSFLGECPWENDLQYVRAVCAQANVPLEVISMQQEYWERVVGYTIAEVKAGRTPNPDMLCNSEIKFGAFYDLVGKSFDAVATGHYAQMICCNEVPYLCLSADKHKDQTYFLARVHRNVLAHMMFPIGHLTKEQVRIFARLYGVPNAERKDSQGICFLGNINYDDFIRHHVGTRTGDLVEWETKKIMGEHQGFWFYTRGQRHGIRLSGGPWYVVSKDVETNTVYVSRDYAQLGAMRKAFTMERVALLIDQDFFQEVLLQDVLVKIRHGEHMHKARVCPSLRGIADSYDVVLDMHDQGIAPGQFAVLYYKGICLGGGIISES